MTYGVFSTQAGAFTGAAGAHHPESAATEGFCGGRTPVGKGAWSRRDAIRASIAAQLAASHDRSWIEMADDLRREYLADADALIDQGLTPWWEEPTIPATPSAGLEAEIFEFDRAMTWFMDFLDARHPDWRQTGIMPSSHIEEADPQEWDAWVSVSVTVSELARRLWSMRVAETSGTPEVVIGPRVPLPPAAASAPAAVRDGGVRDRVIAAVGATLAHRHGRRWMDLPSDLRAAYVRDVEALVSAGLTVLPSS
ncbi:hypothetical protein [Mycolicibacterium goodii]|uniref:hypothetical protein n=1 Tax=Mycolicibacterium goodii TaxID=134601 RepID=UPI001BDDBA05|nr:hypothetical protein [Mycolicibacterium goodii]MBU8840233.1 hypothetical protein [Mycolicibacterium goodii]